MLHRRYLLLAASTLPWPSLAQGNEWSRIEAAARGQTVYFNAWAGSERINAYLQWAAGELAQRRFREVARVAGLVFQGYPGAPKSARQLQASSGLIYEVFRRYDAGNRLLGQAEREVLEQELDLERLRAALGRMRGQRIAYRLLPRPTPFAFPLMFERLREQVTTERLTARIERMLADLESAAR